jgi:putative intracellular protease/amidase
VVVASEAPSVVEACGGGGGEMEVDLALTDVDVEEYDGIVYIGGSGCQSQWDNEDAHRVAQDAVEHGVVLAGIGCGTTILAHAGVLEGREATVCETDAAVKRGLNYREVLDDQGAIYVDWTIVRDGLIITCRPRSLSFVPGVLETIALRGQ